MAEVAVFEARDRLREEAVPERSPSDDPDVELAGDRQQIGLGTSRPQRVLDLDGGDRVGGVGPPELLAGDIGETEVTHVARGDELCHRADRFLDRSAGVREVQVPEVDLVDPEVADARLRRRPRAGRAGVDPDLVLICRPDAVGVFTGRDDSPLGRHFELVAAAADRVADQRLVGAVEAVRIRGVDHRDAEVDRPVDHVDALLLVDRAVEPDQHHGAVADRRGLELAEHPGTHRYNSFRRGASQSTSVSIASGTNGAWSYSSTWFEVSIQWSCLGSPARSKTSRA